MSAAAPTAARAAMAFADREDAALGVEVTEVVAVAVVEPVLAGVPVVAEVWAPAAEEERVTPCGSGHTVSDGGLK